MANEGIMLVCEIQESVGAVLLELKAQAVTVDKKTAELYAIAAEVERRVESVKHYADELSRRLADFRGREERSVDEQLRKQAREDGANG